MTLPLPARACLRSAGLRSLIRHLLVLCCTALSLVVGTVNAAPPSAYTIATVELPGFVGTKADDRPGLAVELARAAFTAVDISVEFVRLPMARLMVETIAGKHDMMMFSMWFYPAETREKLQFIPMISMTSVAFFSKLHFKPQSEDVDEVLERETVVTNFAPVSALTKGVKHRIVRSPASVLDLVMSGREKLGVLPWLTMTDLNQRNFPGRKDEIQILHKAVMHAPFGLAIALNNPDSQAAHAAFSKGLSIIENSGVADEIRSRYYTSLKRYDEIVSMDALYNH